MSSVLSVRALYQSFKLWVGRPGSKSVLVVAISSAFGVAAAFTRGVILSHLLTPSVFGVGIILITITGGLDMFAEAGLDRFIVQSRFGFRDDVIRTSHYFRVIGSLLVGVGIVGLAYPVALLFRDAAAFAAIASTGGVVALRGFIDLRYKLQQRHHRFEAEARIEFFRAAVEVVVLFAVAWIFHSYWAVIAGAYANAAVQVFLSRLGSLRPYQMKPRRKLVGLVGRFSTPIYLNAVFLLAAIQGDRLIVAALFLKSELAFYTVACAIGQGLTVVLGRIIGITLLPRFASATSNLSGHRRQANRVFLAIVMLSTAFLVAMTLCGPTLTRLVYGNRYQGLVAIIFASSIVNMIQIEQAFSNMLLIANGKTASIPLITLMRASALPLAVVFAKFGASLLAIPLAFAIGTALSLAMNYRAASSLNLIDGKLVTLSFLRIIFLIALAPVLASMFPIAEAN